MARVTGGIPTGGYVGKFGTAVFYERDGQMLMRERVSGRNPRSPDQSAQRRGFGGVAKGWKEVSDEAAAAWDRYGREAGTTAFHAYMSLTRRWLRLHPGGVAPEWPPAGPFFGDNVRVTAEGGAAGGGTPSSTAPPSGVLLVVGSQPNAPGVVTEVLAQPLAHRRRKPNARDWKTAAFVTFEAGSLAREIPLPLGAHAVAYRFVLAATGQATAMAVLGATVVP